jgi:hypothetical protein
VIRKTTLVLTAAAVAALAGCGSSSSTGSLATTGTPSAHGGRSSQSPTPSASTTPAGAVLKIDQLGISMPLSIGLKSVSYSLNRPTVGSLKDSSGVTHKPLNEIDLTTPEWDASTCVRGGGTMTGNDIPEVVVTVWDTDPSDLTGFGYSDPAADTKVGSVWLHIEAPADGGPGCESGDMNTVLGDQTGLLGQMVHNAVKS